jgi:hypothetical protein
MSDCEFCESKSKRIKQLEIENARLRETILQMGGSITSEQTGYAMNILSIPIEV